MTLTQPQLLQLTSPRLRETREIAANRRAMWRIAAVIWLISGFVLGFCISYCARRPTAAQAEPTTVQPAPPASHSQWFYKLQPKGTSK